ncbi:MMPL family transporter [Candidatus Bathyarchaeota archaeon]|nr:MAG: MMPL family transporter [Candidatus Bathyarchaeota archaeon]
MDFENGDAVVGRVITRLLVLWLQHGFPASSALDLVKPLEERPTLVFVRLARTITRHNRAVFVLWLLSLVVSVPAILQVQSVIVYSETAFNSKGSESSLAQDIVGRQFSINQGSSVVIVISSGDVRGNGIRYFTLTLNKTLQQDSTLSNLSNVTSIFDIYYRLLLGYTSVIHSQLYQLKNATSLAVFIEFGIPSIYATTWASIVNTGPDNVSRAQVSMFNSQANASIGAVVAGQVPLPFQPIALAYQNMFYRSWNMTFPASFYSKGQLLSQPNPDSPHFRAQNVTKGHPGLPSQPPFYNITLPFIASLPLDNQTRSLFLGTARFFNLYPICAICNNWNSLSAFRTYIVSTTAQLAKATSAQTALIGQIYDLGSGASLTDFRGFAARALAAYNIGDPSTDAYPVQPSRSVYSQFVSSDNNTMLVILDFKSSGTDPRNSIQQVRGDIGATKQSTGLSPGVYVTGAPAFNYDIESETVADVERIDPITILLIIIIIGLFFSSLTAPLVPVSAIGLSVGISFGLVYLIGSLFTGIHFLVLTLLPVAMFGAGSDYCIFLVSRYAEERRNGREKEEAVEHAVTWAGESIATSGATVVIAFGSLAIASFGMLRSIGIAVMLGISIALLVSLTLVPAALSLFGDRLFWPRGVGLNRRKRTVSESYYQRAAKFTIRHSKLIILVALAISLPATSTILTSHTSHDFISQIPSQLDSKAGYDVKIYGITHPAGEAIPYSSFDQLSRAEQQAMIQTMKPFVGADGKSGMVWAVLATEPYSDVAIQTLGRIRENVRSMQAQNSLLRSSTMMVGGATASVADLVSASGQDYVNLTSLVLMGVFIALLLALGSVFTPLRLIFTILLSVSWAMAGVLIFSETFMGSELIWILPIMLLVIMVGLGLDYDIFLVTRIREYVVSGAREEDAIERAVEHTGGIITASGLVTAGAFGTMTLSRIPMLQQLGLGIFIVVLLDASLIRIYLVPAIMTQMKRLNWWAPGRLRRVPVRPEDRLIPGIPLKTKLAISLETLVLLALVGAGYLDYTTNLWVQSHLNQLTQTALETINAFGALILLSVSFLAAFFLLLDELVASNTPARPVSSPSTTVEGPSSKAQVSNPTTGQNESHTSRYVITKDS